MEALGLERCKRSSSGAPGRRCSSERGGGLSCSSRRERGESVARTSDRHRREIALRRRRRRRGGPFEAAHRASRIGDGRIIGFARRTGIRALLSSNTAGLPRTDDGVLVGRLRVMLFTAVSVAPGLADCCPPSELPNRSQTTLKDSTDDRADAASQQGALDDRRSRGGACAMLLVGSALIIRPRSICARSNRGYDQKNVLPWHVAHGRVRPDRRRRALCAPAERLQASQVRDCSGECCITAKEVTVSFRIVGGH